MSLLARWEDYRPAYVRNLTIARAASLLDRMRWGVAIACWIYALGTLLLTLSPAGPHGVVATVLTAVIGTLFAAAGLIWVRRPWPTARMSLAFVVGAEMAHTGVLALTYSPLLALYATLWFALIGQYLTTVHGRAALTLHCAWVTVIIGVLTIRALLAEPARPILTWYVAAALFGLLVVVPFLRQVSTDWLRDRSRTAAELAERDALTGLLNHRGMWAAVPSLLSAARRSGAHLVVAVIDLDRFKNVNDTFGHHRGDEVLTTVARRLAATVRREAVVARTGGEEFLVLDAVASADQARALADRLRDCIHRAEDEIPVTGSVGYAIERLSSAALDDVGRRTSHRVVQELVGRSDAAMYRAKQLGGNRVTAADGARPASNHTSGTTQD